MTYPDPADDGTTPYPTAVWRAWQGLIDRAFAGSADACAAAAAKVKPEDRWPDQVEAAGRTEAPTPTDDLSAGLTAAGLTHALEIIEGRIAWHRRAALEVKHHGREIGVSSRIAGGEVLTMAGDDRRVG